MFWIGTVPSSCFFLSILKSSFIISIYSIAWNETKYPIFDMLGWNLFLLIHFSTESKISSETWFIIYRFSFISMFETVFLKKVFGCSGNFSSGSYFSNFSVLSISFMSVPRFPLFEKKKVSFPSKKAYYLSKKRNFKLLKEFFFSFL